MRSLGLAYLLDDMADCYGYVVECGCRLDFERFVVRAGFVLVNIEDERA